MPLAAILTILVGSYFAFNQPSKTNPKMKVTHSETFKLPPGKLTPAQAKSLQSVSASAVNIKSPNFTALPTTWCGTPTTVDTTVNSFNEGDSKFKMFYVYAADQPNRFEAYANVIQEAASKIHQMIAARSQMTKSIRFDLGTPCGAGYVDIQTIRLPHSLSYYQGTLLTGGTNSDLYIADLAPYQSASKPARHQVFFLDQFGPADSMSGLGSTPTEEIQGSDNAANDGGYAAWVTLPFNGEPDNAALHTYLADVTVHEMAHTIGAVQLGAPHSTGAYHCNDEQDLMCYNDGGPKGSMQTQSCPSLDGSLGFYSEFDCNGDDYFNPNPAPGSYLASHWNLYNSRFLSDCLDYAQTCVSDAQVKNGGGTAKNRIMFYPFAKSSRGKRPKRQKGTKTNAVVKLTTVPDDTNKLFNFKITSSKIRLSIGRWKVSTCTRVLKSNKKTPDAGYHDRCTSVTAVVRNKRGKLFTPKPLVGTVITKGQYLTGYVIAKSAGSKTNKSFYSSLVAAQRSRPVF